MKITSKVLTTTAQQELSAKQRENARGNIGAQVHLESGDHVRITENTDATGDTVVSARIDVTGVDYVAGSDYVTVDAEERKVDLSAKTIEKLDSIPAPANTGTLTIIHGDKTVVFSADDDENREIDTTYGNASDDSDGLMSKEDYGKLAGIETGAEANVQADWEETDTESDAYIRNKPEFATATVKLAGVTAGSFGIVGGQDVEVDIGTATQETPGLMSTEQVGKLAGIAEGAQVNVQADWGEADTESDAYILNKPSVNTVTVTQNGAEVGHFDALSDEQVTVELTDTTYSVATAESDGLMSKEDYAKLAGIAAGAEVNVQADWEEADESKDAFVKNKPTFSQVKVTQNGADVGTFDAVSAEPVTLNLTDTTYSAATAESDGLMSKEDYAKLDGIESGAEANVIESIVIGDAELEPVSKTVTIPNMEGAGEETAGSAGLVPSPSASDREKFLRGDGTWAAAPQTDISGLQADVATIKGYIPSDTSTGNKLTDKAYVDNQINTLTARYLASDENGNPFATYAAFSAEGVKFYYAGAEVTAAKNDYAIVSADESEQGKGGVTRYWYTGTDWSFQYIVNTSPFTPDEWAAIQSGITKDLVDKYDGYEDIIPSKTSDLDNDSGFITVNDIPPVKMDGETIKGSGTDAAPFRVAGMEGATESAEGSAGLVPKPAAPDTVLAGDGLWKNVEIIDKAYVDSLDWNIPLRIGSDYYATVKIGNMLWMKENLRLPFEDTKAPNNDTSNIKEFGYLYRVSSVMNSDGTMASAFSSEIPAGWRIPSESDWRAAGFPGSGISGTGSKFIDESYGGTNTTGLSIKPNGAYVNGRMQYFGAYGCLMMYGGSLIGLMFELPTTGNTVRDMGPAASTTYFGIRLCKNI